MPRPRQSSRTRQQGVRRLPGKKGFLLTIPVHITEDEADMIICQRRLDEPTITLEEYLAEHGYELDPRTHKIRPSRTQRPA